MNSQHVTASLQGNLEMLRAILGDFSDSDMLARPTDGANHAAWQVGHLICSEYGIMSAVKPGSMPDLPAGFAEKFTKQTATSDDPAQFPSRDALLNIYQQQRNATVACAAGLSPAELDGEMPEPLKGFVPTRAAAILFQPVHLAMHVGQLQVIRRKLGKPVLF